MFFQHKVILVFLNILIHINIINCTHPYGINKTVFFFDHLTNCKRSEKYNFNNFSCFPCASEHHLEPSFDKSLCLCVKNYKTVALYDTILKRPVCANKEVHTYYSTASCEFYFINNTDYQLGPSQNIRIHNFATDALTNCTCNKKYNYVYNNYCIWKDLLNNFLSYNGYWQRGQLFADLKFVSFFCQQLNNLTSCNHLANLCVLSFFDTDKNSPCRAFFLSQASDANLYSIEEELDEFQPFLFFKRGRNNIQELEKQIKYSHDNGRTSMELSTIVYSLEGEIIHWGPFKLSHINLCNYKNEGPYSNIEFFKSFQFDCELSMDTIIEFANVLGNKQFFSVFLNYSLNGRRYMQTVPILIENVFDGNMEPNVVEWQMVKRFQLMGAQPSPSTLLLKTPKYNEKFKLHLYKHINILRKFVFNCKVTGDNTISLPYVTLSYYSLDITSNTSLNDVLKFELSVRFEREQKLSTVYKICLPIFLFISLGLSLFRSYTLRCRRYLECCDIGVIMQFTLQFLSYIGNSFIFAVVLDALYSSFELLGHPQMVLISRNETLETSNFMICIAIFLKGLHFGIFFWNTARVDVYFIDWERPKSCEAFLHVKTNLETSSQCSNMRTKAEGNVSAWRIFFVANEWIKLSKTQMVSAFVQCSSSLTLYWLITRTYPSFNNDTSSRLVIYIGVYSIVHAIQRSFENIVLDHIYGSPFKRFVDICTMTNVSVLILVESSYGFYIHGRSPHGSADTDMHSLVLQLQREAQNMCAKRGLLDDSNFQTYIILLPMKLSEQIQKLTLLNTNKEKLSNLYFQTESDLGNRFEGIPEGSAVSYNRLNRFLCAFIDHAIKDMDYIIKEKNLIENMLSCELNRFLTENKGTFYIDKKITFSSLFPYGNQNSIFLMELVLLMTMDILTNSVAVSIIIVCINAKIVFHSWVKNNIANKTLIDKRFLM